MKQMKFISIGLLCTIFLLLTGCISNDPEKLIVGTWEGVSEVELRDGSSFPTVIDYENQTITYDANAWYQTTKEFPCRSILRLSKNGKLTKTFIDTKIGEVTGIIEGDYTLKENAKELSFQFWDWEALFKVEIQDLTKHKLVLVTTEYMPTDDSYFIIYTTSTYKR